MYKFKIGDEIIKKQGIAIIGKIIYQAKNQNYIIFPGIGNMIIYLADDQIELHQGKCKGTYYSMIQSEKKYWSDVNKDSVDKFCIELNENCSVSQNILKSPTLLNGVVIHNKACFEFTKYDNPVYLDHHIDDQDNVWIKIFFSENRIVGWIQSYKIKFVNKIYNDLIYNR